MTYLTLDQIEQYHRDGYVILDDVFGPQDVDTLIKQIAIDDPGAAATFGDTRGKTARLAFWSDTTSSVWGACSTHPNVVNNVRILMQEDVGFFHGKVTLKEAHTGGAWEWHQDFGYWYEQGYVFPRMISVAVALDENTLENGCMRLLKGSHKLGRLNHGAIAGQLGVDMKRFDAIRGCFEEVPAVMKPGAALFFHCNTLHASSANESNRHRRNFIMCYNALSNPQIGPQQTSQRFPCPVGPEDVVSRYLAR
jgi:ectoine hydroxylase-related dioxygenase (phytanoyl-CoA dioxygenase family)